jgi:uncharacterized membrane protein (GlpM family)
MDLLLRFLIGGAVVSLFAALGDMVRPKSFAGIFGAAPSVALATLVLTLHSEGPIYAATEARSMLLGACAFIAYACVASHVMWTRSVSVMTVSTAGLGIWLAVALGGWLACLMLSS